MNYIKNAILNFTRIKFSKLCLVVLVVSSLVTLLCWRSLRRVEANNVIQSGSGSYVVTSSGTTIIFTGDDSPSVLTLGEQGGELTYSSSAKGDGTGFKSLSSAQRNLDGISPAQITKVIINSGAGDNTLIINNPAGSLFAANAEIEYNGGSGFDTLVLEGGGGPDFSVTYTPGPTKDAGLVETTNGKVTQTIRFQGLEPFQDNVPAGTATVNGTPANNAINYTQGPGGGIFVGNTGFVTVDTMESFEFNNKTNLVLNGLAGGDTINLNNQTKPAGLTGNITVNGGDGPDTLIVNGINAAKDQLVVNPTGVASGDITEALSADAAAQSNFPQVFFGTTEQLNLVGQPGDLDQVASDGTSSNDTFEIIPASTTDAGIINGFSTGAGAFTFVPIQYQGFPGLVVAPFDGGGSDTLIVDGTPSDDSFSFSAASPPGSLGGPFQTVQLTTGGGTHTPIIYSTGVASQVVLRGLGGNDAFNINLNPTTGNTGVAIRAEGGDGADTLNYFGPSNATTTIDYGAAAISSTTPNANPVTFSVETINETSTGASSNLTINGTGGADVFTYTPTGATNGTVTLADASPVVNFAGVGNNFTINPAGGSDIVNVNATAGSDTINVFRSGVNAAVQLTGTKAVFLPLANTEALRVAGGPGDDQLNMNVGVAVGSDVIGIPITFDGGLGTDLLDVFGAPPTSVDKVTYTPGPAIGDGRLSYQDAGSVVLMTVDATNIEPVIDLVPAANLTVNGNAGNNVINYSDVQIVGAGGRVAVDNLEPLEFSNKTNLVIAALAGNDTINLNHQATAPASLTAITIDGGDGADTLSATGIAGGNPAFRDQLVVAPTDTGSGTISESAGAGVQAQLRFKPVTFSRIEQLSFTGQPSELDQIASQGTGGDDVFETVPGATPETGVITGFAKNGSFTFVPIQYQGFSGLNVTPFNGGGLDTVLVDGTSGDDSFSFSSASPPGSLGGPFQTVQLTTSAGSYTPIIYASVDVSQVLLRGLGGNDTFNVNLNPPTGNTSVAIRIEGGESDQSTDTLNFTAPSSGTTALDLGTSTITSTGLVANPVSFTGIERVNEISSGAASTFTVTGTVDDDTINVTPTGAGAGSFVRLGVGGSPLFTYTGVGGTLTINGGAGFDAVGILGNDGPDVVTSTASTVTRAGGIVTLGSGLEQLNISTFGGNDSIVLTGLTIAKTIDAGAGNDIINLSAAVDANIFGGPGDDTITGSPAADYIDGGDGNDTINGGPGADTMIGGAGSDKLIWNPGDGSDLVEGGSGTDELVFNGAAAAEIFGIISNGARTTLTRSVGAITMDIGETEQLTVNGLDGDDVFNVAPQVAAHITINGGNPVPPALPGDQLVVDFTGTNNSTRTPIGPGAGVWSFSNRQSIDFTGIETQGPASPNISINNVAVTEGNSGSANATFTVTLSAASAQTVSVDAATTNGTATAPSDYQTTNTTLTFPPGVTTANFNVPINGDTTPEGNETILVNLTNAVNGNITTAQGTGTINDDDATNIFQFNSATTSVAENAVPGSATVTVTRTGDLTGAASVKFETTDGTAKQKSDYTFGFGTVKFAPGESSKDVKILLVNDVLIEGPEAFQVTLSNPSGNSAIGSPGISTVTITDDDVAAAPNPIDDTNFFVRQHYLDFLGREPDAGGLAFWNGQISACGANASCIAAKRVDVSAAFFLSIEFQETGAYAFRMQRAAFGRQSDDPFTRYPYLQFMRDSRTLADGVVVGQPGYATVLEQNKQAYAEALVATPEFATRFPAAPAAVYVDALFASAGVTPTAAERTAAINAFGVGGTTGRVAALRSAADAASLRSADFRVAFVLAEYYGYLRRNPTDAPDFNNAGYQFWLDKMNLFNGDYIASEMVKAFITSPEYRQRFGP